MNRTKITSFIHILIGLIIFSLLIGLFVVNLKVSREYELIHDLDMNLLRNLKLLYFSGRYIIVIITLFAFLGLFILRPFGWIAVSNLFYFTTSYEIYIAFAKMSTTWTVYFYLLIPLSLIGLMNTNMIANRFKILRKTQLIVNMVTIMIALVLTYLNGYLVLNKNMTVWELVDIIK